MCGRYSIGTGPTDLAEELAAELAPELSKDAEGPALAPRYNVAPTLRVPMLVRTPHRRLGAAEFGWTDSQKHRHINARVETLTTLPSFAEAASRRRCLIVADGFYEWEHQGTKRTPYFFKEKNDALLTMAGVYEVSRSADGTKLARFVIVTVPAKAPVTLVHDRMPLLVPPGLRDSWLLRDELGPLEALHAISRSTQVALVSYPVDPRVGRPDINEPSLRSPHLEDTTGWLPFDRPSRPPP